MFPPRDFRTEWGPVFHRGRLDGSARLLVIGQDPAQHEIIVRRNLVGGAGHRIQGFMAKLGLTRNYVMVNTFVYSVFGQGGGNRHKNNPAITGYRNRWFDALLPQRVQVSSPSVSWRTRPGRLGRDANGQTFKGVYTPVTRPTQPESSSQGDRAKRDAAIKKMLQGWNGALATLHPVVTADTPTPLVSYGAAFLPEELPDIPQEDLPAGSPADVWKR